MNSESSSPDMYIYILYIYFIYTLSLLFPKGQRESSILTEVQGTPKGMDKYIVHQSKHIIAPEIRHSKIWMQIQ